MILTVLVFIVLTISFIFYVSMSVTLVTVSFFKWFLSGLFYLVFPHSFIVLFGKYNYQRMQLKEAEKLNQKVTAEKSESDISHYITAENGQLVLQLNTHGK
jgi:hypothetical protein